MPYLVRHQSRQPLKGTERASSLANSLPSAERLLPGLDWPMGHRLGWWAGAFIAPASNYCKRANTLAAYGDVNKYTLSQSPPPSFHPAFSFSGLHKGVEKLSPLGGCQHLCLLGGLMSAAAHPLVPADLEVVLTALSSLEIFYKFV